MLKSEGGIPGSIEYTPIGPFTEAGKYWQDDACPAYSVRLHLPASLITPWVIEVGNHVTLVPRGEQTWLDYHCCHLSFQIGPYDFRSGMDTDIYDNWWGLWKGDKFVGPAIEYTFSEAIGLL